MNRVVQEAEGVAVLTSLVLALMLLMVPCLCRVSRHFKAVSADALGRGPQEAI